ncbi:hypothetical protein MKX03_000102 [Papaver bracteatum]|nr:hypothetical protein MKX03_000102 [Papaver bracteatum]
MAPSSKAALDAASWMFNVVTSVGIISVNKALMATYSFIFAITLTGLYFASTTLMTFVLKWLGYIQPTHLPLSELLKFVIFANFSIVGMNVSLMWNSVGFYQIAKLSMIPVSCILEVILDKIRYSRDIKLSILLVLLGVAVCTGTDVTLPCNNIMYITFNGSINFSLLGHTAPVQAASLLVVGPFLDYWLTGKRVDHYDYNVVSVQFICIGRFTAVSFQVLGHMKTILVLILGFILFRKEGLNPQVVLGMIIAVLGMIWYGNASSKPGGKERCSSHSLPTSRPQKHGSDTSETDGKIYHVEENLRWLDISDFTKKQNGKQGT